MNSDEDCSGDTGSQKLNTVKSNNFMKLTEMNKLDENDLADENFDEFLGDEFNDDIIGDLCNIQDNENEQNSDDDEDDDQDNANNQMLNKFPLNIEVCGIDDLDLNDSFEEFLNQMPDMKTKEDALKSLNNKKSQTCAAEANAKTSTKSATMTQQTHFNGASNIDGEKDVDEENMFAENDIENSLLQNDISTGTLLNDSLNN